MAKLSKVDAAKATGVSRQTLYTYIKDGRLSVDADGLIDTAELLRAGFTLHTGHEIGRQDVMATGHELTSSVGQHLTSKLETLDVYRDMIALLKQHLSETQAQAQARDQAAQERERDYREQIARLTTMLDQAHQQNQRLLDLPRTPPPSTTVVLMKLRDVCSANIWRSLDANGARRTKPECAQRVAA